MSEELTLDAWRSRLDAQGHHVAPGRESAGTFTLWPGADTIVTVAVEPDGTLRRRFRERFFLCESDPERVFRFTGCPEPHRTRWLRLVDRQPLGYWRDFLAGPGAWTLSRLLRFPEMVVWAERGLRWADLEHPHYREWGLEVPAEVASSFAAAGEADPFRPRVLQSGDELFADAVGACFLFALDDLRDCYFADREGTEVYLAHHHDKVVVSIPTPEARRELLEGIEETAWLFTDVSGFAST
jgi:hypothetical protein